MVKSTRNALTTAYNAGVLTVPNAFRGYLACRCVKRWLAVLDDFRN